jgi:hypothetical protein
MYIQQLDMHVKKNSFMIIVVFIVFVSMVYNYYHGNDCGKNNGFKLIT